MRRISPFLISLVFLLLSSCSTLSDISNALASLKKMEFRISGLSNMRIAGVDVSRISDPSKLSVADGIALSTAFARKSLPTTFTLNVDARNPNNGSQGARNTPLTLSGLDWRLLIDDKQTITGNIDKPIEIPGTAPLTNIPLSVSVDMYKFFADRGYDGIINLALALGGTKGSTARVKLDAQPSVGTAFGTMTYPSRITIVDSEFRGN
jgi:hypothetical protein